MTQAPVEICETCGQKLPSTGPYTTQEIQQAVEKMCQDSRSPHREYSFWCDPDSYELPLRGLRVLPAGKVQRGGGDREGAGYTVFSVTNPMDNVEQFFKKTGYYTSYDGWEWDGSLTEVEVKTETVTTYKDKG